MYEHRDDVQPSPPGTDDEVTQRRLRWALLAAVALVLLAAIPGIALNSGGDTKKVTSAQQLVPATTTTTGVGVVAGVPMAPLPAATTTTVAPGSVTALQTGTTVPTRTTTTATPPPAKACRNSYDPVCGPFRCVSPQSQQVSAGQEVNFHVVGHDRDANVDNCIFFVDFGDGQKGGNCPQPATCQTPYGPWTPPAKVDNQQEFDLKHTYAGAGTYQVSVVLQSHSFCNPDPYGGSGQHPATVTVS